MVAICLLSAISVGAAVTAYYKNKMDQVLNDSAE